MTILRTFHLSSGINVIESHEPNTVILRFRDDQSAIAITRDQFNELLNLASTYGSSNYTIHWTPEKEPTNETIQSSTSEENKENKENEETGFTKIDLI